MTDISNIINVALLADGVSAARDSMNVTAIMTSQQTGPLDTANPYALYRDIASVGTDFGTDSDAYAFASTYLGTTPNPTNAGGVLVMGYWRAGTESVAATAAVVEGAQLTEATVVVLAQSVSDGSFDIDVDGDTVTVTGLDLRTATSLDSIAAAITIAGAVVSVSADNRIVIASSTTGASSTITLPEAGATGTFVGAILGLSTGTGAVATQGAASGSLSAETPVAALTRLKALVNFKGFCFIDQQTDENIALIAAWCQSNGVLGYDVFSDPDNLLVDTDNIVWSTKLAGKTNYRMLYSAAANRKLGAAYMARAHVVNFGAENSALTMHLKTLNVEAESYTETQIANAKTVGLDVYTTIKNVPVVLTSGANDFVDTRYNLLAFIDAVQTDMFNLLHGTSTKIPQTQRGVNQLIDQGEKTTREFVRAGVFAPGTWTSPDYFGDQETFYRAIAANGFYWLAGSLADQSTASRNNRESPVLQAAVKNAGAIHSVDIIINFNQ